MTLKKKAAVFGCAALLSLALAVPVAAAQYADLPQSHWAYEDMSRCAELGLLSGVGGGQMGPGMTLSWGQYLTMLSRAFDSDSYSRKLENGVPWDLAGYEVAKKLKLVKADDILAVDESSLSQAITRRDVAILLSRAVPQEVKGSYALEDYPLSDLDQLSRQERAAVERMVELGITRGKADGTFGGQDTLMRSDGSVMLLRALEHVDRYHAGEKYSISLTFVDESGAVIDTVEDISAWVGSYYSSLAYSYGPKYHDYVGSYGYTSTACDHYTLVMRSYSRAEIEEAMAWEQYYNDEITYDELLQKDFWLYTLAGNPRKCQLIFDSEYYTPYSTQTEADASMARVTVPVWKLSGGKKVASAVGVTINAALADEVVKIFTEIFEDPEQFPMHSVGGYNWRGGNSRSEHCIGTAIDINPNENYQVSGGSAMVGSFWDPDTSPYSIGENSSVVRIFREHGWSWGGNAWSYGTDPNEGYHDYMHFSYFGN